MPFFFRALEMRVGAPALDAALSSFYGANRGRAATMQQLLDHIAGQTGYDPDTCATAWLRGESVPADSRLPMSPASAGTADGGVR